MECGICHEVLDEEEHCPLLLPCSHSICATCIGGLIDKGTKSCPFCRQAFSGTSTRCFSPNFALLDMLKYVKRLEETSEGPLPEMKKKRAFEEWFTVIENDIEKICRENKMTCCDIENLMEKNSKLESLLIVSNRMIDNEIGRDLMETKKSNENLVRYIQEVNKTSKRILSESKGRQLELEEMQSNLKPNEDFISAFQLLDETEKNNYKRKDELMKGKVLVNRYKTHTKMITKLAERRNHNLTVISGALPSCVTLKEEEVEFLNSLNEKMFTLQWTNRSIGYMVQEKLQKFVSAVQGAVVFLAGNNRMVRSLFEEKLPMLGATVHDFVISPVMTNSITTYLLEKKQQILDIARNYQAWTRMSKNIQRGE